MENLHNADLVEEILTSMVHDSNEDKVCYSSDFCGAN
jgi:hypothetical protein